MLDVLPERGRVCSFNLLLVLACAVFLENESRGIYDHIVLYKFCDSPNLVGQVSVFLSPRDNVAKLYHQALSLDQSRHITTAIQTPQTKLSQCEVKRKYAAKYMMKHAYNCCYFLFCES